MLVVIYICVSYNLIYFIIIIMSLRVDLKGVLDAWVVFWQYLCYHLLLASLKETNPKGEDLWGELGSDLPSMRSG